MSAADSSFALSWDVGNGKFPLKNKDAVIVALSDSHDEALEINKESPLLMGFASNYRAYALFHPDDKNLDKWKVAGTSLTRVYDAAATAADITIYYVSELMNAIRNNTMDQAQLFDKGLRNAKIAVFRLETQVQEATEALMDLRDVHKGPDADGIYGILLKLLNLSNIANELRASFLRLIDAAGIES
ncbi:hypothetical protein RRG08_030643 [Elysia crispata]|uniref:Uncharacterized protein n=1 Tax=Elysia crispata TaxID=231223 RepID=A0AAE1D2S2_9GAST|nr:hypothetical protein RRG08_030643 [Elysia crispata]